MTIRPPCPANIQSAFRAKEFFRMKLIPDTRMAEASIRPTSQRRGDGLPEDLEIQPEGPVSDVVGVEADDLFEVHDVASPADLPEAGDPRECVEPLEVVRLVGLEVVWEERPGPDETHVTLEDVE